MNMHYSGLLNGFRVGHNVMRPGPVGRNVKLVSKVQGPNGSGGPMPYISPPLIRALSLRMNQGVQEAITIREAQWVDIGQLRNLLMRSQKAFYV